MKSRCLVFLPIYITNRNSGCLRCGRLPEDIKSVIIAVILNVINENDIIIITLKNLSIATVFVGALVMIILLLLI